MTGKNQLKNYGDDNKPLKAIIPSPLRRESFRQLWIGMTSSYAGDRFQQLAQTWLVAILTSSALAVGWIGILGSIPLMLMPLGGVMADLVNRRRLLITWQIIGGLSTVFIAILVWLDQISVWHIYLWAIINGLVALFSRPAYKVFLTKIVPPDEVRPAVSINSMTETSSMILVNAVGSLLLEFLGLSLAFFLNALTYFTAVGCLWGLEENNQNISDQGKFNLKRIFSDLVDGLKYLVKNPTLLNPLLLTFATILVAGPTVGLLAAIVESTGGTIVELGLLSAVGSLGALVGAGYAGFRQAGKQPVLSYSFLGLISAVAIAVFALLPVGYLSMIPLAILGAATFSQAVWNTSRVAKLADQKYQGRLQAITSMAFNLGFALSMFWGGAAIDRFGLISLVFGAALLGLLSLTVIFFNKVLKNEKGVIK